MQLTQISAPPPDLRIIPTESALAHEEHDSQRSAPLVERIRESVSVINPPIVAPISKDQYVILDGANRFYAFTELNYPHIIVQIAPYESGYVQLDTWRHIVSGWNETTFLQQIADLEDVRLDEGQNSNAVAHIIFPDGRIFAIIAPVQSTHERNAVLRHVVATYQRNASLFRTAITEPEEVWPLYPDATAIVIFPHYHPNDIIAAAKYQAYLPPGISRHIIHGRALRVNYPLEPLRDTKMSLQAKNDDLRLWVQERLANRQVRYYAEAVYQFDE